MNKANECTCPSGDGSLRWPCPAHPAVEQAGGDERAAFERAFTVQEGIYFDGKRGEYRSMNLRAIEATDAQDLNLRLQGWQARAALAQPSPAQAEAERPEVVARVVHSNPVVLGQCGPLNANDELMTVAQHAASVARWAEMFNRVEQQRDAALARVAELEKKLAMALDAASKGDAARHAACGMEMEIQELREKVAELQKELRSRWTYASTQATNCAGCGEHKHTPLRVDWMGGYVCLTCIDKKLEELHDDQAQHSVPEGWKLVPLEAPVEMLRAGSIALGMEPLSDGSDGGYPITGQQSTIRQCYAAMLAALPGKEGV
ncbi:hypothetical protein O0072_18110 [Pseudomonas aeruginosa]|uniref:hypothetical protein n=1 Tax=Pseudomonas aeruginosa TaxID=287 RepID=UPI002359B721|nr:hypothetical protein KKY72_06765 [Pseudomonas aeruginosa]